MQRNVSRLGLGLFLLYLAFYGGFIALNAFAPQAMELTPVGGVNLAVLYGFALIGLAIVLAVVYGVASRDEPVGGEGGRA
jgi:uncharacterized membrane protein (DUF485 family)